MVLDEGEAGRRNAGLPPRTPPEERGWAGGGFEDEWGVRRRGAGTFVPRALCFFGCGDGAGAGGGGRRRGAAGGWG